MHVITEDTPPDMLAGAMDLFIHLPTGNRSIKMAVERSTPMMDLLVQICTNNNLQLSKHTLQAIEIAPSPEYNDRILPYKPNTPIGVLDTQNIRVVPKTKSLAPVPKNIPPGHQPFESTFRLKVHLPRNQLYVFRVSQHIHLSEVMKKVCDEKNLDPSKYEFRHPANFDESLNPNLTISDYQITEVYLVTKGTNNMNQAFSPTDIMTLRKEEERKQMHNKTGGGVFNLIFRKVKGSTGSTLTTLNDSSSGNNVVKPSVPKTHIIAVENTEKPKPPPRKRRPAPKPPQNNQEVPSNRKLSTDSAESKPESGITICHSRNSSDSSGYHEASILSDHGNSSLPRRPGTDIVVSETSNREALTGKFSQSTSNLTKMSGHSKSTSSLFLGRKKKAAPAPPPPTPLQAFQKPATSSSSSPIPPPAVVEASQSALGSETSRPPVPRPRSLVAPPSTTKKDKNSYSRKTMFDSYTRKRGFQIGLSLLQNGGGEEDTKSIASSVASSSEYNSIDSALNKFNFVNNYEEDEYENGVNIEMFHDQELQKKLKGTSKPFSQLHGIHSYEDSIEEPQAELLPHLSRRNLSKSLDDLSGEYEEIEDAQLNKDSLPVKPKSVSKTEIRAPPSLGDSDSARLSVEENIYETIPEKKTIPIVPETSRYSFNEDIYASVNKTAKVPKIIDATKVSGSSHDLTDGGDWTYRLPSPPLGFKDVNNQQEESFNESSIVQDSIVTSPELFEKGLNEDERFKMSSTSSDVSTSTMLLEEREASSLSNLTLENLEKRQSLVYNRELTTSFKNNELQDVTFNNSNNDIMFSIKKAETLPVQTKRLSVNSKKPKPDRETELLKEQNEKLYEEIQMIKESQKNHEVPVVAPPQPQRNTNTLPNFKISSYGGEKKKVVNIFEDDTVRSNNHSKQPNHPKNESTTTQDYNFYKPNNNEVEETSCRSSSSSSTGFLSSVSRTKSFSSDKLSKWAPSKPVTRSKSHTALHGRPESGDGDFRNSPEEEDCGDKLESLSNSLTDISGLQSLGVLRVIQNKLSTPTSSCEALNSPSQEEKPAVVNILNRYSTPSINMSTWSERPKVPVILKEDEDYKLKTANRNETVIINNNNNNNSNNRVVNVIKVNEFAQASKSNISKDSRDNSTNIRRNSGNVTITIGGGNNNNHNNNFVNCTTALGYRKPFGNINKIERPQRPHSIAFDSDFDISRVPVVRSVEFKKPFKHNNNNTSITQINMENDDTNGHTNNTNNVQVKFRSHGTTLPNSYRSATTTSIGNQQSTLRYVNSFGSKNKHAPIVRGFKSVEIADEDFNNSSSVVAHQSLPFLHNLNKANKPVIKPVNSNNSNDFKSSSSQPPPPPKMMMLPTLRPVSQNKPPLKIAQNNNNANPRDELLSAIRNFGGKKGLRTAKMC